LPGRDLIPLDGVLFIEKRSHIADERLGDAWR
jgi:hypothetical protein